MDWIWKSVLLIVIAMLLLRISGRKSISQMSVATTVIIISIGTTIVQPIANHQLGKAIGSASVFILTLLAIEYAQVRFDWMERLFSGKATVVIENGQPLIHNLKSLRLTIDQLEMLLRQLGIASFQDIKIATIESNGQLGYELVPKAKPVTVGMLEQMLGLQAPEQENPSPLFEEVLEKGHHRSVDPKLK